VDDGVHPLPTGETPSDGAVAGNMNGMVPGGGGGPTVVDVELVVVDVVVEVDVEVEVEVVAPLVPDEARDDRPDEQAPAAITSTATSVTTDDRRPLGDDGTTRSCDAVELPARAEGLLPAKVRLDVWRARGTSALIRWCPRYPDPRRPMTAPRTARRRPGADDLGLGHVRNRALVLRDDAGPS
jgi:hypothetical protein